MSIDNKVPSPASETQIAEFNAFYLERMPVLVRSLSRYGAPPADAEDAAQHGMMQLFAYFSNVGSSDGERFSYATTAAIRHHIARSKAPTKERAALANADWDQPEPFGGTRQVDSEQHILRLLRRLSPKQQITVALWVDGGSTGGARGKSPFFSTSRHRRSARICATR
jgi:DNA-directed RNA polymerase specialized sigma24 family protein